MTFSSIGRRRARSAAIGVAAGVLIGLAVADWLHQRAATQVPAAGPGSMAVLVLGYPTPRSGRPGPLQRWRAVIAVRTVNSRPNRYAVFTGGRRRGPVAESVTMAEYARTLGLPAAQIRMESDATTTWENIQCSLALVEDADQIAIASDPLHARRARRYLSRQRPDLASRLVAAYDYVPGEHLLLKTQTAAYEMLFALRGQLLRGRWRCG